MAKERKMQTVFLGNVCELKLFLPKEAAEEHSRRVENIRNCDIFIEDNNFYFYVDVLLFKFRSRRPFNLKIIKSICVNYNSKEFCFTIQLPCLPQTEEEVKSQNERVDVDSARQPHSITTDEPSLDLWKLKRITEQCQLQLDNCDIVHTFDADFDYGFACKYKGELQAGLPLVCGAFPILHVPEPCMTSPVQRTIERELEELHSFSREQYKLNFVELQIPEGHDNPMTFNLNFDDCMLTEEEIRLLHNITRTLDLVKMPAVYDKAEIDCGLISILLAISYDIRTTNNEPTCESAWTRNILSASLSYFEPFDNLKEVVISFLRRSIIYPLYRNYELSRRCVDDTILAMKNGSAWILKQLLMTHQMFVNSEEGNREILNRYYIEDYIRYVYNAFHCSAAHLQLLARNLKNVTYDIYKKHLRLNLSELETELLKEIITDIHINMPEGDNEDDSEEDGFDSADNADNDEGSADNAWDNDTENESSSESETEENSVIEQSSDILKN